MIRSTISVPNRRAAIVAEFFPAGAFACFLALALAVFRPVFAGEGEGERIIRARSFMRSFAEKIASGDTEGLAAMHHPKGIFRSWDEPGDYEEPLDGEEEENLSREQWRQKSVEKFPWLQYSLRGDIPEGDFYHRILFKEIDPGKVEARCRKRGRALVNLRYFADRGYPIGIESVYVSKGQETLWAAKPESRFEDGCEIELPYMHLEIFWGKTLS